MEKVKIFLEISDDILEWMADNHLSIEDILEKEGIEAEVEHGIPPDAGQGASRSKDLTPILCASAFALPATLFALGHCLKTYLNKPIHSTWEEDEEIRDQNGEVLLDRKGNPQMKRVRKHFTWAPGKGNKKEEVDLKAGAKGLVLGIRTEEKESKK